MTKEIADQIIGEYMKKIYGFALSKTVNVDYAEELASRIVFEVYKSLLKAENIHNVNSYIYRISKNVYAQYVREQKSEIGIRSSEFGVRNSEFGIRSSEFGVRNSELNKYNHLKKQISYLSNLQREIVILHYFDRLKIKEIAKRLNLPLGTVKWHLFDARNSIKSEFGVRSFLTQRNQENAQRTQRNQQVIFDNMRYIGIYGSHKILMSYYFPTVLSQKIAYSAYHLPRTSIEIAKDISVPVAFVEDEISRLVENSLINKLPGNKYSTNIYIIEPKDKGQEDKIKKLYDKYAEIVCERYIPLLKSQIRKVRNSEFGVRNSEFLPQRNRESTEEFRIRNSEFGVLNSEFRIPNSELRTPNSKLYIPQNDRNFLMWTIVSYACYKKLITIDKNKELMKFMIKRKDGGKNIAIVDMIDTGLLKSGFRFENMDSVLENSIKDDVYPIFLWMYFTQYDTRKDENISKYLILSHHLYDFMKGRLLKEPKNIDIFRDLYENGLLVSNYKAEMRNENAENKAEMRNENAEIPPPAPPINVGGYPPLTRKLMGGVQSGNTDYVNMVVTSYTEEELDNLLPDIPEELVSVSKEFDAELFKIHKAGLPPQMHDLCRDILLNSLTSGKFRAHLLQTLLNKGILKPLKKRQEKTVNMILFINEK